MNLVNFSTIANSATNTQEIAAFLLYMSPVVKMIFYVAAAIASVWLFMQIAYFLWYKLRMLTVSGRLSVGRESATLELDRERVKRNKKLKLSNQLDSDYALALKTSGYSGKSISKSELSQLLKK